MIAKYNIHTVAVGAVLTLLQARPAEADQDVVQNLQVRFEGIAGNCLVYQSLADGVYYARSLLSGETTELGSGGPLVGRHGDWLAFQNLYDLGGDVLGSFVSLENVSTGEVQNLRDAYFFAMSQDWVAYSKGERQDGVDLNGDGDTEDGVLHVHDLSTGTTRNLELPTHGVSIQGEWLVFTVIEWEQGQDLNADGDSRNDQIVHVHHLASGETKNLGVTGSLESFQGDWLVLSVHEWDSDGHPGEDLNHDGDTGDEVVHIHVLSTGETRNLGARHLLLTNE